MAKKLILYIASSLDGFIAGPGDDLSFLDAVQREGEDYGYTHFMESIDTVIMGRRTFDWVFRQIGGVPHPDKTTYVITHTPKSDIGKTSFFTGDLVTLVKQLKEGGTAGHIFCDGGASIIHHLLCNDLIDEIVLSIVPILLGNGIRLFENGQNPLSLQLLSARSYASGLCQLHYARSRS